MQDDGAAGRDVVDVPAPARALHSDPHDFAGLYIRHRASFTLHARRYLRDARDADEVVQEAFLRLFLALPELETELQALAYCRRTITNLCIDRFRAQARRPSLVDLDSVGAAELADEDPGDPVVRAEDAATVRAALSLLSPLHRAALVKREIEEKTLPVIAEELDIAEDSVKHVLFRARRALRRILASTSLAPGSDAELSTSLAKVARGGSGGLAAFLLLLVLGLGSGPDLRAIPVVGTDLPALLPVTEIADAVTQVVAGVADVVVSAGNVVVSVGKGGGSTAGSTDPIGGADPVPAVAPEPSPTAGGAVAVASPTPVPAPVVAATSPSPSPSPSPVSTPGPGTTPGGSPSPDVSPSPGGSPSPSPAGSPSPAPSSEPSPKREPRDEDDRQLESTKRSPSPSPSPSASSSPSTSATSPGTGDVAATIRR